MSHKLNNNTDIKLKKLNNDGSLDNKWKSRYNLELLSSNKIKCSATNRELYVKEALSCFKYYEKYINNFNSDLSLKTISSLCNDTIHHFNVEFKDPKVTELSQLFNNMVDSNRKLLQCYDCGTVARSVFLSLIDVYRKISSLTEEEINRMKNQYSLDTKNPLVPATECYNTLTKINKHCIFICSVAFGDFGHVWTIEKILKSGKWKYYIYQSALNSHLLLDFIEMMDYANPSNEHLDINEYFSILFDLLKYKGKWKNKQFNEHIGLFAFKPLGIVNAENPGFSYTYIILDP